MARWGNERHRRDGLRLTWRMSAFGVKWAFLEPHDVPLLNPCDGFQGWEKILTLVRFATRLFPAAWYF